MPISFPRTDFLRSKTSTTSPLLGLSIFLLFAWIQLASPSAVLAAPPVGDRVLFVTAGNGATAQEQLRIDLIESWGYTVTTIRANKSQGAFNSQINKNDVAYVSEQVLSTDLGVKLKAATIGVVFDEPALVDEFGLSSGHYITTQSAVNITDNSHYLTSDFNTGALTYVTSAQSVSGINGTLSTDLTVLAYYGSNPALAVLETGDSLYGGGTAAGRRVKLPWASSGFDTNALNADGQTLLRRAIEWASGANSATQELVAHWKLDETSGATAADATGNGHDGAVSGNAGWTTSAIVDGGFQFDGATGIDVSGVFGEPASVTVSAWANLTSADTNGAEVISLGDRFGLRLDSGGAAVVYYHDGTSMVELTLNQTFAGEGWHHFVAVFDDDQDTVKLYVDGAEAASAVASNSISYAGGDTRVGRNASSDTTYDFTGTLDDVRVYNYALSQSEIIDLYGLLGHWFLDETSGVTAVDSSPAGNDGTYVGGVTLGGAGPHSGTVAADFDGNNDYVSVPNESSFDVTQFVSIAAWIKVDQFDTQWQTIIAKGDSAWRLSRNDYTNTIHFAINSGATQEVVNGSTNVNDGQWHHIVGVYDGANMMLYIDGVLDATSVASRPIDTNDYDVYIAENTQYTGRNWDGALYDVRVYNRPLGQTEIDQLSGSAPQGVHIIKWVEIP